MQGREAPCRGFCEGRKIDILEVFFGCHGISDFADVAPYASMDAVWPVMWDSFVFPHLQTALIEEWISFVYLDRRRRVQASNLEVSGQGGEAEVEEDQYLLFDLLSAGLERYPVLRDRYKLEW